VLCCAALVFPAPLTCVFAFLNSIAWHNNSTAALPAPTIAIIVALFLLVALPLTVVGGIAGRNLAEDFQAPCRTKKVAREVRHRQAGRQQHAMHTSRLSSSDALCVLCPHSPLTVLVLLVVVHCSSMVMVRQIPKDVPCFRHPVAQLFMAGFLPFSAIYIELHYIFNSIWGHKIYTLFGILFLAFTMLFIVTSFITIALIYFQVRPRQPPHGYPPPLG
jgi:hypothetical protein